MEPNALPPMDTLHFRYSYDPQSGKLFTKTFYHDRWSGELVFTDKWKEVTTTTKHGYVVTTCQGQQIKAHRICWALHHGEDPYPLQIDHINRKPSDNRIVNLRRVTSKENNANRNDGNHWKYIPVRITYPDGRGVIVVDSIKTAALILNMTYSCIQQHLKRGNNNSLRWEYKGRRNYSGIHVDYA